MSDGASDPARQLDRFAEAGNCSDDRAPIGSWDQAFAGDPVPTAAMLDRLLDHSTKRTA